MIALVSLCRCGLRTPYLCSSSKPDVELMAGWVDLPAQRANWDVVGGTWVLPPLGELDGHPGPTAVSVSRHFLIATCGLVVATHASALGLAAVLPRVLSGVARSHAGCVEWLGGVGLAVGACATVLLETRDWAGKVSGRAPPPAVPPSATRSSSSVTAVGGAGAGANAGAGTGDAAFARETDQSAADGHAYTEAGAGGVVVESLLSDLPSRAHQGIAQERRTSSFDDLCPSTSGVVALACHCRRSRRIGVCVCVCACVCVSACEPEVDAHGVKQGRGRQRRRLPSCTGWRSG